MNSSSSRDVHSMAPGDGMGSTQCKPSTNSVCIIGGCGHIGLPLGIALADRGCEVTLFDIDAAAVEMINAGEMPFKEDGAETLLPRLLEQEALRATADPSVVATAEVIIVVIGTPVDEHLNPDPSAVVNSLEDCREHFIDGQLFVLRSTVYPGVTREVERYFERHGLKVDVAFCPERIAEGHAMTELFTLPQIIGSRDTATGMRAADLFTLLAPSVVMTTPEEAELAKLFTNVWRYIKFAAANQFYMMANDMGVDFEVVRGAITHDYPRAADMPGAGFAAGPCLFKDTMQLSAFNDNRFLLGHSAMLVNEGLPLYLVDRLERTIDLKSATVGILGMAFKGDSDDRRESLSYKLKRVLRFRAGEVLTTDPYVPDDELMSLDDVLERADVVIIGAPHTAYRAVEIPERCVVVDVWNLLGKGVKV